MDRRPRLEPVERCAGDGPSAPSRPDQAGHGVSSHCARDDRGTYPPARASKEGRECCRHVCRQAATDVQVQDIVVGTKSLTDVAKPSEIVSLFMDDEELAESVAKRRQAEAHGYVAPQLNARPKSSFGDHLAGGDDDEDDFFSLAKKPANEEDDGLAAGVEGAPAANGASANGTAGGKSGKSKKKGGGGNGNGAGANGAGGGTKRKAAPGAEGEAKKPSKKKVKMVGPDGLPL